MSRYLKSLMLIPISSFSFLALGVLHSSHLEAACGRWATYNTERGAWGGNGGWWGESNSNWYGVYGTREEYPDPIYHTPSFHEHRRSHYYHSNNYYPHYSQYYGDSVDGGALYFNIR